MMLTESDVRAVLTHIRMDYVPFEYTSPLESNSGHATTKTQKDLLGTPETAHINPALAPTGFFLTYLHEACHVVAGRFGLDELDGEHVPHNQFFAALVAICYHRLGMLPGFETIQVWRVKLYDFGDAPGYINGGKNITLEGARGPDPDEWTDRLRFVLKACEHYAGTSMSIEAIAADLARWRRTRELRKEAAQRQRDRLGQWVAVTVGVALSLGVIVGGRVLGLI
jgi:hypothetical protein